MSVRVVSLGGMLVEIYAKERDQRFHKEGVFLGPYPSGAPAIFVDALARIGCPVGILATVGDDGFGTCLLDKLEGDGADVGGVVTLDRVTTGCVFTSYNSDGTRRFIYYSHREAPGRFAPEHVSEAYLKDVEFLHLTGNVLTISDSSREACMKAIDIVTGRGGRISFDPNIRPEMMALDRMMRLYEPVLDVSCLIQPSEQELAPLTGIKDRDEACRALLKGATTIVTCKRGAAGASVFTRERKLEVRPYTVEEVDPTGAGDCFDAGFVYGIMEKWPLEKCLRFANALGARAVTRQGAMEGCARMPEIETFMKETPGGEIIA
jgi:sugar/nucleoside kinase (ribokinase family)